MKKISNHTDKLIPGAFKSKLLRYCVLLNGNIIIQTYAKYNQ